MKRGPAPGSRPAQTSPMERAKEAWGTALPEEIIALAQACTKATAASVAQRLGYAPAVISQMISNSYKGSVPQVLAKIRGAYMGETRACPVLGDIGSDRCLKEQKMPFAATNSTRARLFHACPSCFHSVKNREADHGQD